MASFLGSLNKNRYLIFMPIVFDNKGSHKIDMNLVYAQAFALFQDGFRCWLNEEEIEKINEYNKRFIVGSVEEEMLETYYRPATDKDENKLKKLQTYEIIEYLMEKNKQDISEKMQAAS